MKSKPDDFGKPLDGSRWFNRKPNIRSVSVRPIGKHWECPMDGCEGEMVFNGKTWPATPTTPVGLHHTCRKCGFTAAIPQWMFPFVDYEEVR